MSTRATIAHVRSDGTIERIYHHWDGYPGFLGRRLLESYNCDEEAARLISGGDISIIEGKGATPRYYAQRAQWDTWFKGDGEGEPWENVKPDIVDATEGRSCPHNWAYLWDGRWYVRNNADDWQVLTSDIVAADR